MAFDLLQRAKMEFFDAEAEQRKRQRAAKPAARRTSSTTKSRSSAPTKTCPGCSQRVVQGVTVVDGSTGQHRRWHSDCLAAKRRGLGRAAGRRTTIAQ